MPDAAIEAELLEAVVADPDAEGPRAVIADWWQRRGNPRGRFVSLQLAACERDDQGEPLDVSYGRIYDQAELMNEGPRLYVQHAQKWFPALSRVQVGNLVPCERGFPRRVHLDPDVKVEGIGAAPEMGTVRAIHVRRPVWPELLDGPSMRNLRHLDFVHEGLLGALPAHDGLQSLGVALQDGSGANLRAVSRFPALRSLQLLRTMADGAGSDLPLNWPAELSVSDLELDVRALPPDRVRGFVERLPRCVTSFVWHAVAGGDDDGVALRRDAWGLWGITLSRAPSLRRPVRYELARFGPFRDLPVLDLPPDGFGYHLRLGRDEDGDAALLARLPPAPVRVTGNASALRGLPPIEELELHSPMQTSYLGLLDDLPHIGRVRAAFRGTEKPAFVMRDDQGKFSVLRGPLPAVTSVLRALKYMSKRRWLIVAEDVDESSRDWQFMQIWARSNDATVARS